MAFGSFSRFTQWELLVLLLNGSRLIQVINEYAYLELIRRHIYYVGTYVREANRAFLLCLQEIEFVRLVLQRHS